MSAENINLNPEEFAEGVKTHNDAIILDVRTPEEFGSGHLPGAVNINIQGEDFHEQVENLDPEKPYYVYCRSGARSSAACRFMQSKGFNEVYNLLGGILAWEGELA
jgi:rhodanese-related sulfurtransferase